jgi:5-methylcytosine-specific restriction protein A
VTDVATTARRRLTPTQRLRLFEEHKGVCALCGNPIRSGEKWIVEHIRPLGLGGTNDTSNLAPVHAACGDGKTHGKDGDAARIAKAKRVKMRSIGISRAKQKIPSRPFPTSREAPRIEKSNVPRRPFYTDET